jgi:predicted TIM-barrel enzyme/ribosomal protein S27E
MTEPCSNLGDIVKDNKRRIEADKSIYLKCSRCWNHKPDCMYSKYWQDTLCERCAKVLCDLEEKGLWRPGQQNELVENKKAVKKMNSKHRILPVIHVKTEEQAIRNTKIAKEAGCDGVFLINHAIFPVELLEIHAATAKAVPDWWIGINCLGFTNEQMFKHATPEMRGIWTDNADIDETVEFQTKAKYIDSLRKKSGWKGAYFGGVALKYQRPVKDLEKACELAMEYVDVVTTSGPGTAQAADINKIERMHKALGKFPLAIASGITIDNVESYMDKTACFLVASGINKTWDDLDPVLVKQLVDKIRSSK